MALILEISASREGSATVCADICIDQLASKITTTANFLIYGSPNLPACYPDESGFCTASLARILILRRVNALDAAVEPGRNRRHRGNCFLQDVRFELTLGRSNQESRTAKHIIAVAEFHGHISSRGQGV